MNVTFSCPRCERPARVELEAAGQVLKCPHCKTFSANSCTNVAEGLLEHCLVCRSRDVYLRKDFPQRLGVLIVALGFVASSVTWAYNRPIWTFTILFATALVDVVLYLVMPSALVCYHCGAQYRGLPKIDQYAGFDLETHERHRQEKIRASHLQRSGGAMATTAVNSPETSDSNVSADTSARG